MNRGSPTILHWVSSWGASRSLERQICRFPKVYKKIESGNLQICNFWNTPLDASKQFYIYYQQKFLEMQIINYKILLDARGVL